MRLLASIGSRGSPARSERGSVTLVAAAVMVAMAIIAMACADVARTLAAASAAQTAADAAALAAAQELALPGDSTTPRDVAAEYAVRDGAELLSCQCDPGTHAATVAVRVTVGPLLLFGAGRTVDAGARAEVDLPG
jgi:secretion/DNA translocation related TadE-like protein